MEATPRRPTVERARRGATVQILVAEQHPVVRRGIEAILGEEPSVRVVRTKASPDTAVNEVGSLQPDVVIVPAGPAALETVRLVRERSPATQIVMVVAVDEEELVDRWIIEAVPAGVSAFVTREDDALGLVEAVHRAAQGLAYVAPAVLKRLVDAELQVGRLHESQPD